MMNPDAIVTVVAYVCNDADVLGPFVAETVGVLAAHFPNYELILVDDHSTDTTPVLVQGLLARHAGIRYVRLARPVGGEVACHAGLEAAVGDYVVVMRARFDPPAEVVPLVQLAVEEGGTVLGVSPRRPPGSLLFRCCRAMFYRMLALLMRSKVPANATGFCALTRPAVNTITRIRSRRRHLRVLACTIGYPVTLHPYRPTRAVPEGRRPTVGEALKDAIALTVISSRTPLRLVSSLGVLAGSFNLCYVLYVLAICFFKKEVAPGWTTLSLQIAAMFFFVFLILVALAEYVAQTLEESQGNPLYHVEDDRTSAVSAGSGRPSEAASEPVRLRNVLTDPVLGTENRKKGDEAA
jgi:glycosyltransferase involved in cell wall biosynthesis